MKSKRTFLITVLTGKQMILMESLKASRQRAIFMSEGTAFHNLEADTDNEFSKRDVLKLGMCNKSLSTDRVLLFCVSKTFVNKSVMYSGVIWLEALYTIAHVWYWTLRGNDSHFKWLKMLCEGVKISTFRIIRVALFCYFINP